MSRCATDRRLAWLDVDSETPAVGNLIGTAAERMSSAEFPCYLKAHGFEPVLVVGPATA
jgi:hypothetical protein